jgi:hypothetical protein
MTKMTGYESVDVALACGDKKELSRLGKKGVDSRKKRIQIKILMHLSGAMEAQREAHEDICPLND